jgi:hypothetical protein
MSESDKDALMEEKNDSNAEDDELMEEELKPHCLGHRFHSSEVFFFLVICYGIFLLLGVFSPPELVGGILNCVACAVGTMLVWNLVSIKRIAAAAELMRKDLNRFKAENDRACSLQEEKKKQDAEFKQRLADMEKAELLLKDAAKGLEGIADQEKEMMGEAEEMLAEREKLSKKLVQQMEDMLETSLANAKNKLKKRAIMYFKAADEDNDGINVGDNEWKLLDQMMSENGIKLDPAAAGDDGMMDRGEFRSFLQEALDEHFPKLEAAVKHNMKIEECIYQCKLLDA